MKVDNFFPWDSESWKADIDDPDSDAPFWTGKFYVDGHPTRTTFATYGDGHSPQDETEDAVRANLAAHAPKLYRALESVMKKHGVYVDDEDDILKLLASARGEKHEP